MKANKVDARGLPCPQPVVMTKKALEEMDSGTLDVLVDNKPSSQNVARFVKNAGCLAEVEEKDGVYIVHVTKGTTCETVDRLTEKEIVVFISSNTVGRGDVELGIVLMRSFIPTLLEIDERPKKIVFMNSGVKLTVTGSPVLEHLQTIEKEGVELLVCGTCLDFFGLKDKVKVGSISNMFELVTTLSRADKVMSL